MNTLTIVSDSTYTVQGHGVHTAFLQHERALRAESDIAIRVNGWKLDSDVVHIHTFGPIGLYHALFARGKKVISAHVIPESLVGSIIGAKLWLPLAKRYLRWFYNKADTVVAVSPATAEALKSLKVRVPIETIPNAIDSTQFSVSSAQKQQLRKKLLVAESDFIVLGCGQLQPRKRADILFDLAKKIPNMQFIWVGGIPFKAFGAANQQMEELAKSQLSNFSVTGVVSYQQAIEYFKVADVFLFPSEQETFGLVVVEAAAAGLPVITRNIPDYKSTFGDDIIAVDEQHFKDELKKLYTDAAYYKAAQAKSMVLAKRYDARQYATSLVALYRSITSVTFD